MPSPDLESTVDPAPSFWLRPHLALGTQPPPTDSSVGRTARKAMTVLASMNNLCLPPMATIMVFELALAESTKENIAADWFMLMFCISFGSEWLLGLLLAAEKKVYLWNFWLLADLISAIPFSWLFQTGRVVRMARVARVLRLARYRKLARVARLARFSRLKLDLTRVLRAFGLLASVAFSGALALRITEPELVRDLFEAFWWALVTISAVGYGDIVPTSPGGRVVGMLLILGSLGVFGYAAALATSALQHPESVDNHAETMTALKQTEERLGGRLDRLEAVAQRIEASLNRTDAQDGG